MSSTERKEKPKIENPDELVSASIMVTRRQKKIITGDNYMNRKLSPLIRKLLDAYLAGRDQEQKIENQIQRKRERIQQLKKEEEELKNEIDSLKQVKETADYSEDIYYNQKKMRFCKKGTDKEISLNKLPKDQEIVDGKTIKDDERWIKKNKNRAKAKAKAKTESTNTDGDGDGDGDEK